MPLSCFDRHRFFKTPVLRHPPSCSCSSCRLPQAAEAEDYDAADELQGESDALEQRISRMAQDDPNAAAAVEKARLEAGAASLEAN